MNKRNLRQAIILAISVVLSGGSFVASPDIRYTPFIGFAFGCAAISIAVQQIFVFSTDIFAKPKKFVYLWSSLTLVAFGASVIAACLPNMLRLPTHIQTAMFGASSCFGVVGLLFFFRFAAAYLYRETQGILSDNALRVFRPDAQDRAYTIETCHLLTTFAILGFTLITLLASRWSAPPASEPPASDLSLANFFPMPLQTNIGLVVGFALTAFCICLFYISKYKRLREGEPIDGLLFMQAMVILFAAPSLVQASALLSTFGVPPYWALGVWTLTMLLSAVFVGFSTGQDGLPEERVRALKGWLSGWLALCALLSLFLLADDRLLVTIPFFYVTLGFLTLGAAYLPIYDLQLRPRPAAIASKA